MTGVGTMHIKPRRVICTRADIRLRPWAFAFAFAISFAASLAGTRPVSAEEPDIVTRSKTASFDDVRFDLNNAIISTGVVIELHGNIAAMLGRTAADLGATITVYLHADFVTFCSAKYSRAMMEADPSNIGFCPFVVFAYETRANPGVIVVGYRRPKLPAAQGPAAAKAAADVDALLAKIVDDTLK